MLNPSIMKSNFSCKKFLLFNQSITFQNRRYYSDCLYSRRLKKVILRAYLSNALGYKDMLKFERIDCKGKVINFDDPKQREPFYERLFKISLVETKKMFNLRYFDQEKNTLPAHPIKDYIGCLMDFTSRRNYAIKFNYFVMEASTLSSLQVRLSGDAQTIDHPYKKFFVNKLMPRGQESAYESINRFFHVESRYFWESTLNNDLESYGSSFNNYWTNSCEYDSESGISILYAKGNVHKNTGGSKSTYYHLTQFKPLKRKEGDPSGRVSLTFIKKGTRMMFMLPLKIGTMVAIQFRRVYLLNVYDEKVDLRVISIDAIAKSVNFMLTK